MNKVRIFFLSHKFNKNSIAALTAAIQVTRKTSELEPVVLWDSLSLVAEVKKADFEGCSSVVCFSFTTLHFLDSLKELLLIKEQLINISKPPIFLAGGAHPSGSPEETLRFGFDYVVKGEGELAFPAFISALMDDKDPCEIKGVCSIKDGMFYSKGRAELVVLDDYPPFASKLTKFSYIEITRGCPVACKYCQTSYVQGAKYRHRSSDNIIKYVEKLVALGIKDLRFITPDCLSFGSSDVGKPNIIFLEHFLKELKKAAKGCSVNYGSFPSEVFPTSVNEETMELLSKYSSNDNIVIGAQTGSDRMMKEIGRSHTVDDVRKAVLLILKKGFMANVDFMFGLPGETEDDEDDSISFMTELCALGAKVHGHTFMPLAGTPFAKHPPVSLSTKTIKTLERLTGMGVQYGSWKAQMLKSNKLFFFRDVFSQTQDLKKALQATDDWALKQSL